MFLHFSVGLNHCHCELYPGTNHFARGRNATQTAELFKVASNAIGECYDTYIAIRRHPDYRYGVSAYEHRLPQEPGSDRRQYRRGAEPQHRSGCCQSGSHHFRFDRTGTSEHQRFESCSCSCAFRSCAFAERTGGGIGRPIRVVFHSFRGSGIRRGAAGCVCNPAAA